MQVVVVRPIVIGGQDRVEKPPRVGLADQREEEVGRRGPDGHRSTERAGPAGVGRAGSQPAAREGLLDGGERHRRPADAEQVEREPDVVLAAGLVANDLSPSQRREILDLGDAVRVEEFRHRHDRRDQATVPDRVRVAARIVGPRDREVDPGHRAGQAHGDRHLWRLRPLDPHVRDLERVEAGEASAGIEPHQRRGVGARVDRRHAPAARPRVVAGERRPAREVAPARQVAPIRQVAHAGQGPRIVARRRPRVRIVAHPGQRPRAGPWDLALGTCPEAPGLSDLYQGPAALVRVAPRALGRAGARQAPARGARPAESRSAAGGLRAGGPEQDQDGDGGADAAKTPAGAACNGSSGPGGPIGAAVVRCHTSGIVRQAAAGGKKTRRRDPARRPTVDRTMPSADLNAQSPVQPAQAAPAPRYRAHHKIRVVTAAALFDGHDAAIGVMRRVLQASGAEVIHLGHNRGAEEVVDAAIQEDAQAIALSSYQGGHVEYFEYMHDLLRQKGAGHITIWGGGGGVIVPREIEALHAYGIQRIFSPEDGRRHGLQGMIDMILRGSDFSTLPADPLAELAWLTQPRARERTDHKSRLARLITAIEALPEGADPLRDALQAVPVAGVPVLGITGTGGAGKSSLTDELLSRLLRDHPDRHVAVVSVDPTRRRTGGALLGDRIRMNALRHPNAYMRSLATRQAGVELSRATDDVVRLIQASGYDLVIVETSGIGQGDAEITRLADLCLYVMTAEYGAPSQLEKIEMLDLAQLVAINKFEHKGSKDALRDVRKQVRRNREIAYSVPDEALPVFGTVASRFHDSGVNGLYAAVCDDLGRHSRAPLGGSASSGRAAGDRLGHPRPHPAGARALSRGGCPNRARLQGPRPRAGRAGPRARAPALRTSERLRAGEAGGDWGGSSTRPSIGRSSGPTRASTPTLAGR